MFTFPLYERFVGTWGGTGDTGTALKGPTWGAAVICGVVSPGSVIPNERLRTIKGVKRNYL